jgi:hypothetical protein
MWMVFVSGKVGFNDMNRLQNHMVHIYPGGNGGVGTTQKPSAAFGKLFPARNDSSGLLDVIMAGLAAAHKTNSQ